jgi:hypothetical protein
MMNLNSPKLLILSLMLIAASSCKKKEDAVVVKEPFFKSIEKTDSTGAAGMFPTMMLGIVSPGTGVQIQQNLLSESYANYLETPGYFLGNINPTTYVTKTTWVGAWTTPTNSVMNNWLSMKKLSFDTKYPDLYAVMLILKVAAGHRIVDSYGPYPYTTYGAAVQKFDSVPEAYTAFFRDLDQAITSLQTAEAEDPNADQTRFKKMDRSSLGGEYTRWIKLANTLRLRLAIRLSVADAALAKTQAEKACLPTSGGFLDETTGNWSISSADGTNGHYTISEAWGDTRISAAVVSYLQGYGDPRLTVYVKPATDVAFAGQYKGIRPGIVRTDRETYQNFSYNVMQTTPMKLVDGAENYFLKAEGALRGWNMGGGTAQSFYEAGIRASLKLNGVTEGTYLSSTSQMLSYVDPKRADNNSARLTDNVVKWDDGASMEQKLEKIITQKWIAVFPEGTEAWSEFRRTGYPKLYAIKSIQNNIFQPGEYIKRLTYPSSILSSTSDLKTGAEMAVSTLLSGKDDEKQTFYWMKP